MMRRAVEKEAGERASERAARLQEINSFDCTGKHQRLAQRDGPTVSRLHDYYYAEC